MLSLSLKELSICRCCWYPSIAPKPPLWSREQTKPLLKQRMISDQGYVKACKVPWVPLLSVARSASQVSRVSGVHAKSAKEYATEERKK